MLSIEFWFWFWLAAGWCAISIVAGLFIGRFLSFTELKDDEVRRVD